MDVLSNGSLCVYVAWIEVWYTTWRYLCLEFGGMFQDSMSKSI